MPADRATSDTDTPGSNDAATRRSFSSRDHRRRLSTDVITSTRGIVIGLLLGLSLGLPTFAISPQGGLYRRDTPDDVDFVELSAYAGRAKTAYATEAVVRTKYPATVLIGSPGATDAQYFVERDDKARVQHISVRGTANRKNILEDIEIRVREDLELGLPIHSGFDATSNAIYSDMKPYLKRTRRS